MENQPATFSQQEMTLAEMMFILSAGFYVEASNIGQKALEEKNQNFVVVRNENDPTVKDEEAKAESEMASMESEEASLEPPPEDSSIS
jgi:hypothetical protein